MDVVGTRAGSSLSPSPQRARIDLDVPFSEKDQAKGLGARWDPAARCWYVPPSGDPAPFARWRSAGPPPELDGPTVPARLVAVPERCWRCAAPTLAIAGILVDPDLGDGDEEGFVEFDEDIARAIGRQMTAEQLAELRIGPLRPRWSGTVGRRYLSNGCLACDALLGNFPLHKALVEFLHDGGAYDELVVADVEVPEAILPAAQREREEADGGE